MPSAKAIRLKKKDDVFLRSKLSWQKHETYHEFALVDLESVSLKNGKNSKIPVAEVKFRVDLHGNFLGTPE